MWSVVTMSGGGWEKREPALLSCSSLSLSEGLPGPPSSSSKPVAIAHVFWTAPRG